METFDTPSPISLDADLGAGSVHVIAAERGNTTVVVNPQDPLRRADVELAARTTVEMEDGTLKVTSRPGAIWSLVGTRSGVVELTVELPERSSIDVRSGAGDVTADGVFGSVSVRVGAGTINVDTAQEMQIKNGAGSIRVNRAQGDVEIASAGDMYLGRLDGAARIKNMNGRTWIGVVGGRIRVKSANGDIAIDSAGSDVLATTASGRIAVAEVSAGEIDIESAAGVIEVGIRDGAGAFVDATTKFGRVHNTLEAVGAPEEPAGAVALRARTSFGDIFIHRSAIKSEEAGK